MSGLAGQAGTAFFVRAAFLRKNQRDIGDFPGLPWRGRVLSPAYGSGIAAKMGPNFLMVKIF
jgi:hypothetical protein